MSALETVDITPDSMPNKMLNAPHWALFEAMPGDNVVISYHSATLHPRLEQTASDENSSHDAILWEEDQEEAFMSGYRQLFLTFAGNDNDSLSGMTFFDRPIPGHLRGPNPESVVPASYRIIGSLTDEGEQLHALYQQGLLDEDGLSYLVDSEGLPHKELVYSEEALAGCSWLIACLTASGDYQELVIPHVAQVVVTHKDETGKVAWSFDSFLDQMQDTEEAKRLRR